MGKDVHMKEDARRACTGVLYFVLIMAEERDVPCLNAQKVREDGQAFVSVTAGGKGASTKGAGRVRKAVRISARHMVEESVAHGDNRSLVFKHFLLATSLLGGNLGFVLHTVRRCKTSRFLVLVWAQNLAHPRR